MYNTKTVWIKKTNSKVKTRSVSYPSLSKRIRSNPDRSRDGHDRFNTKRKPIGLDANALVSKALRNAV